MSARNIIQRIVSKRQEFEARNKKKVTCLIEALVLGSVSVALQFGCVSEVVQLGRTHEALRLERRMLGLYLKPCYWNQTAAMQQNRGTLV